MRFSRTGLFGILASAVDSSRTSGLAVKETFHDPWLGDLEVLEQLFEAMPVFAAVLAASIVPFEHNPQSFMVVPFQAVEVAEHSVVVEVAPELGVEGTEEPL